MFRKNLGVMVTGFLSLSSVKAFGLDWSQSRQKEIKTDILALAATADFIADAAGEGATAGYGRAVPPRVGPAEVAFKLTGFSTIRVAALNASKAVSIKKTDPWWCEKPVLNICSFIPVTVTSGTTVADSIARTHWSDVFGKTMSEAMKRRDEDGSPGPEVGLELAQLAFELVSKVEKDIYLRVQKDVPDEYIAQHVHFAKLLQELKSPMEKEEFRDMLPEIQEWYVQAVNKIEQKIGDL